jgi:hypothetical protein
MLLGKIAHQTSIAPSPGPAQPKSTGTPAQCLPLLCSLLCPKLSDGLVQTVDQSGSTRWRPKEQVIDAHARPLKP